MLGMTIKANGRNALASAIAHKKRHLEPVLVLSSQVALQIPITVRQLI
jgi:hypothetical protein